MGLKNLFQKKKQPGMEESLGLHEEEQKKFHVAQVFKFEKKVKTTEERYLIIQENGIEIQDFNTNDVVQTLPWITMKWFEVHPHTKQFHIQTLSGIKADRLRFDTKQAVTIHNTCETYLKRFIRNKKLKLEGAPKVYNDVMCRTPPRPPPLPPKEPLNLSALSDSAALSPSFNSPAFRESPAVSRAASSGSLGWSSSSLGGSSSSVASSVGPSPGSSRRPARSGLRSSSASNASSSSPSSKKAMQPILGPLVNWEEDDDSLTASMGGMIVGGGGGEEDESSYQSKSTPQMRYNQSLVF